MDCFEPVRHSMVIYLPKTTMKSSLVLIGVLFTHVYGISTIDEEFNRNVFHDDEEYTMIDPSYSLGTESEPENQYFRQIRAFQEDYKMIDKTEGLYTNFPLLEGWKIFSNRDYDVRKENSLLGGERMKRSASDDNDDEKNLQVAVEIERDIEKHLGKPLEIAVLDLENATETINKTDVFRKELDNNLIINDFIRFKRDLNTTDKMRPKREKDLNDRRGKTLLTPSSEFDTSREPRGATKEQWVKQPYPVLNSKAESYEDSAISNSDFIRAPRVHFVTQRRSESSPTPVYKSFDRDSRARELIKDYDYPRNVDRNYYQHPPRNYENYPPPPYRPNYYRLDRPRYENAYYDNNNKFQGTERPVYNKQRRIIYYATLPEVVRTPNVDLNDRYNYRDRYDSRFLSSTPLAVPGDDPYRYRKPYPLSKSRYDEIERSKTPYSLKVSTDINVREIKKNPERRIYSEGDRRYAYGIPSYHRPDEIPYSERRP